MPNTSSASSISLMSEVEEVEGPQEENIDYSAMTLAQLKQVAKEQGIEGYSKLNKSQLIEKLG